MKSPLKQILRESRSWLYKNRRFVKISEETGLSVSWLRQFADGQIDNPTVNNLDILYQYINKQ